MKKEEYDKLSKKEQKAILEAQKEKHRLLSIAEKAELMRAQREVIGEVSKNINQQVESVDQRIREEMEQEKLLNEGMEDETDE